jgi:coproporphyrinogen III oxidase
MLRMCRWQRDADDPNAGYGVTAVLEGGSILEKAASNISVVRGVLSAERAAAMSARGRAEVDSAGGQPYSAMAMSMVFHAANPFVPTLRADVRMFEVRLSFMFECTISACLWQLSAGGRNIGLAGFRI